MASKGRARSSSDICCLFVWLPGRSIKECMGRVLGVIYQAPPMHRSIRILRHMPGSGNFASCLEIALFFFLCVCVYFVVRVMLLGHKQPYTDGLPYYLSSLLHLLGSPYPSYPSASQGGLGGGEGGERIRGTHHILSTFEPTPQTKHSKPYVCAL